MSKLGRIIIDKMEEEELTTEEILEKGLNYENCRH